MSIDFSKEQEWKDLLGLANKDLGSSNLEGSPYQVELMQKLQLAEAQEAATGNKVMVVSKYFRGKRLDFIVIDDRLNLRNANRPFNFKRKELAIAIAKTAPQL